MKENPIIASHSKNKRRLKWRNKIQISQKCGKPVPNPPKQKASVWGPVQCRRYTDFFVPTHTPVGQKTSLINFKHKIMSPANYTDSIGTGYTSHANEMCLHIKTHQRRQNFFVSKFDKIWICFKQQTNKTFVFCRKFLQCFVQLINDLKEIKTKFCFWCRFFYFSSNINVFYIILKLITPRTQNFLNF